MSTTIIFLDGVSAGALVAISFLYVILPLAALLLLIWFFVKRKRKNR